MELTPQQRYARWLSWGMRIGLALLVASFAAYLLGLGPHVPIDRAPELWSQPARELLARTGLRAGWGWAALLPASDMLVMAAIAVLASCSIPPLLAAARSFARAGERTLWIVCALEVAVLVLAASGVLAVTH